MAISEAQTPISVAASADLSSCRYCGVYINSSGLLAVAGEGNKAIGILQDKPAAAGRPGLVCVGGKSPVKAGATLAPGAAFSFGSGGTAIAVGSGDDWSMGIILETANTASGSIYTCLVQPTGPTV